MESVILKPRGRGTLVAAVAIISVTVCVLLLKKQGDILKISGLPEDVNMYMVVCVIDAILVTFISELLRRIAILHEESFHFKLRYGGSKVKLLTASFGFGSLRIPVVLVMIAMATFCLAFFKVNPIIIPSLLMTRWNIIFIVVTSSVAHLIGLREPTTAEMSKYLEENRLNAGHGMAWSYYFGYLKLILPNFDARVKNWIDENAPKSMYSPKLHILVPRSCYCYPSLNDADSRITIAGTPEPISASRAGTIKRLYKNTIYKIEGKTEEDTYYFVAEYATPVLSLYEMAESDEAGLSADEKLNQMKQFYTTLSHILSVNPEFVQTCVLVPYDDKLDEDEVRIGDVLKRQVDRDTLEREISRSA